MNTVSEKKTIEKVYHKKEDTIMTIEEFVFDTPLYHMIDHTNGYDDIITSLVKRDETIEIEGYNPIKKRETTYYIHKGIANVQRYTKSFNYDDVYDVLDSYDYSGQLLREDGVKSIILKCKRYGDIITIIVAHSSIDEAIMKVGQFPSVADIHIGQIKKYNKILEKPSLREFTKAIGLAANGVGIGSFVYLRRIFEGLVNDAYEEAKKYGTINEASFEKQRMNEKIESLQGYLPPFIVEHSSIYGILSNGIHELSEDECLAYFDTLRASIEMILDQRIEQKMKKQKESEVVKKINSITANSHRD